MGTANVHCGQENFLCIIAKTIVAGPGSRLVVLVPTAMNPVKFTNRGESSHVRNQQDEVMIMHEMLEMHTELSRTHPRASDVSNKKLSLQRFQHTWVDLLLD